MKKIQDAMDHVASLSELSKHLGQSRMYVHIHYQLAELQKLADIAAAFDVDDPTCQRMAQKLVDIHCK